MAFANACARAGLPTWETPHDPRHFYASTLIRSGASVMVVQGRLGHSSAKTTLDVYGHLFPDEEDRTRTAIDGVLATAAADAKRGAPKPPLRPGRPAPVSDLCHNGLSKG